MKKVLTICIPTYRRQSLLRRCIDSVLSQIEKYSLSKLVDVYVSNDASLDETVCVLDMYTSLSYFHCVTRECNLGMNVNIRRMLSEVAESSYYQLIITDDDYLQPNTLAEIVELLQLKLGGRNIVPAIWTPRYSYREGGELHCIIGNRLKCSSLVRPSAINAGRNMENGCVLSGLILRAECIDYVLWEHCSENAYFPLIVFGDLLFRNGAYYWNYNIVHHTVLNECYWERFGSTPTLIELRLFGDFMNAYNEIARKINIHSWTIPFYLGSFPSTYRLVNDQLFSGGLRGNSGMATNYINELRAKGILKFSFQLHLLMVSALLSCVTVSAIKLGVLGVLTLCVRKRRRKEYYGKKFCSYLEALRMAKIVFKLVVS